MSDIETKVAAIVTLVKRAWEDSRKDWTVPNSLKEIIVRQEAEIAELRRRLQEAHEDVDRTQARETKARAELAEAKREREQLSAMTCGHPYYAWFDGSADKVGAPNFCRYCRFNEIIRDLEAQLAAALDLTGKKSADG